MARDKGLVSETTPGGVYQYLPLGRHIVAAPGVCGGRPTFKHTRIDVSHAMARVAEGHSPEQVARAYEVPVEAVREAMSLAAGALEEKARLQVAAA